MNTDQIRYLLAKGVGASHTVQTNYGDIDLNYLDKKDRERVIAALKKGLENELRRREEA